MGSHDRLVNAAVPVGVTIAALAALFLTTASRSTSAGRAAPRTSTSHASYAGSPSSSPHPSPSPSPSTSTVRRSSTAESVATVTSFAYEADAPTPTAAATVNVVTRDTAPVTLVLHFAGGNSAGEAGDNAGLDDDFTLSGHTAYTITEKVTALQYCYTRYFGVTASLNGASLKDTAAGTTSFRQLASPACT